MYRGSLHLLIHSLAFNVIPSFTRLTLLFNMLQYSNRGRGPQDGTYFDNPDFEEATRLIELKLTLIDPEAIPHVYTLDRFPDSPYKHYPTLYFTGSSRGIQGNEATVIGSVTMSEGGVVRWRFVSPIIITRSNEIRYRNELRHARHLYLIRTFNGGGSWWCRHLNAHNAHFQFRRGSNRRRRQCVWSNRNMDRGSS